MNRDELVAAMRAAAPVAIPVECAELGGTVYVRAPAVRDMDRGIALSDPDGKYGMALALTQIICDADGDLVFDKSSEDDMKLLASQPAGLLNKLLAGVAGHVGVDAAKNA